MARIIESNTGDPSSTQGAMSSTHRIKAALVGGSLAATLDLLYAFAAYAPLHIGPERILQSIASGWFGAEAYVLGIRSALLGAVSHFTILWLAALCYAVVSERWPRLHTKPRRYGVVYGLLIFAIMNAVVVPLSNATVGAPAGWMIIGALFAHTMLVGVPIAVVAARFATTRVDRTVRVTPLSD